MRQIKLTIPVGEEIEVAQVGNYVRVRESLVTLTIQNADASEVIEADQGDDFQFSDFKSLRIRHDAGTEQSVKLIVSRNKRAGSSQVGGSMSIPGGVSVNNLPANQGGFTQGRASVTNVNQAIIAANAARRFLMIQNNDASQTLRVTLSGVAATAAQGFRIGPGDSLDLSGYQSTAAINAMMEAASASADNVEFAEG